MIEDLRAAGSCATELQVHLSETVVWCSSSRLVEIFLEVRMSLSEVNDILYEEAVIPCGLLLNGTNAIEFLWCRVDRWEHRLGRWLSNNGGLLNNDWRRLNNDRGGNWLLNWLRRRHNFGSIYHVLKSFSHGVNQVSLGGLRLLWFGRSAVRCE